VCVCALVLKRLVIFTIQIVGSKTNNVRLIYYQKPHI